MLLKVKHNIKSWLSVSLEKFKNTAYKYRIPCSYGITLNAIRNLWIRALAVLVFIYPVCDSPIGNYRTYAYC